MIERNCRMCNIKISSFPTSCLGTQLPLMGFLLLAVAFFGATALAAEAPSFVREGTLDIEAAVAYFEDLYRAESSVGEAELTVVRPRNERTLRMKTWSRGMDKALVVIQAPPREAGTATLKVDKNLWNFLPKIKRTVRIPPSMMLSSWMGSDFTNDDLVREASYTDDYAYELVGPSASPPGWVIRFTAKPETIGLWEKIDLVVDENGSLPLRAEYFDRRGRLSRVLTWDEVREFDDRLLPGRMIVTPEDQEGHQTILRYLSIDFGVDVPESTFSLSNLEQQR
jgi:outer membrane lipoprotein-sorting protein